MKKHTKEFKSSISTFGRELDSKIFVLGTELVLEKEDLFSITPVVNSEILKTIMKEVDFESKKQIGIGQEVNVKSGVKVNGKYEYIDYGNYSVYKSEYKAETDTYSHICYDKMLKTMIDYTPLDITYPINLREYINAIATKCGLEFADKNNIFANYNTSINEDHFSNGNYTFRDVLDYIAQLVGGWLCINNNDELEIRYPELARNYDKVNGENVSFTSNVEDEINTIIVDGKSTQATSTNPVMPSPDNPSEIECVKGKNLIPNNWKLVDTYYTKEYGKLTVSGNLSTSYLYGDSTNFIGLTLKAGTYTFSASSDTFVNIYAVVNNNGTIENWNNGITKTFTSDVVVQSIRCNEVTVSTGTYLWIAQIEKGTVATSYLPYDIIQVKDVGKNLFNPNTVLTGYFIDDRNGNANSNSSSIASDFIEIKPNTNYYITRIPSGNWGAWYDENKNYISGILGYQSQISPANAKYMRLTVSNSQNNLDYANTFMVSKGSVSIPFEPYQEKILNIDLQGNELCSLPNNVKDELVIENGRAKIIKRVGKYNITGNEAWALRHTTSNNISTYSLAQPFQYKKIPPNINNYAICNSFEVGSSVAGLSIMYNSQYYLDKVILCLYGSNTIYSPYLYINIGINTLAEFKTWLKSADVVVYYELETPTEIDLGKVDTLSTFKGINNVSLDANMQTNMNLIYTAEYEELDKHFLKDVNVSFSKKYGAVNSVVFSRGNGSDNIYRKDNASINKNGLTEIKIADNPFLEGDDRENFIQQLFDKINGLEFYIMDVASTGIMYLELGDLYYFNMIEEKPSLKSGLVKSGMRKAQGSSGGKFLCLLMNDEIKITQGLEENIYSDEPEITETNYKTASITDTSIKNAIIQTNKNSAEILLKVNNDEVVSAINLSPENIKISSAKLDIDAIATFTNSKLAEAGSTVINGANITTGSINCDRLNGGTINGQAIRGGSISIEKGVYYFNMGTSTSNPNCSGLNVGGYGVKAYSDITATGFAITDGDTGKSQSINIYDGHGRVWYLTFTGGILTASEYK